MKQDFLKTVGGCREHENVCGESASAEKIYNNVIRKITLCEKRRKRKKAFFCVVSGLTAIAAIFCLFVSSWKDSAEGNQVTQVQDSNYNTPEKEKQETSKVVFCVYEAQRREQTIRENYMSVMKKREVGSEKEIELGTYDPLTSTVPGYPVMISNSKSNETDVEFSITTLEGQLLQWNQETGEIKELGKSGTFKGNEKIFWSPLSDGKLVKETQINVDLFIRKHLQDNVSVKITMETENAFIAKRIK